MQNSTSVMIADALSQVYSRVMMRNKKSNSSLSFLNKILYYVRFLQETHIRTFNMKCHCFDSAKIKTFVY